MGVLMTIKVRVFQNVSGTAYQKLSHKIIQGIIDNPDDKEIDVLLTGWEHASSKSLMRTHVLKQLEWFKSQGYTVIFNDTRL
ncbi:hypothetical protein Pylas_059 [Klebsiella phage Pylas]|uniref:Uncharacterized protein n=1 Tax=Klebsiella phage Pylas TaxID=2419682 RepID=A0A3G3BYE9_9CAUD|nr:hypothetical protein HYP73_gp59 [Klebsiella phage Pylas]AYP69313.1 hypothetical protein Pylas_059 [Klebsiella phage Pylas]